MRLTVRQFFICFWLLNSNRFASSFVLSNFLARTVERFAVFKQLSGWQKLLLLKLWLFKYRLASGHFCAVVFWFLLKAHLCPDHQQGVWRNTGRRKPCFNFCFSILLLFRLDKQLWTLVLNFIIKTKSGIGCQADGRLFPVLRQALTVRRKLVSSKNLRRSKF